MPSDCPTCADLADLIQRLEVAVASLQGMPIVRVSSAANIRCIPRKLTPVELVTLRAIIGYWRENMVGPRMADLGKRLGVSSQCANERVKRLAERGLVTRDPKSRRSVRAVYDPDAQGVA